MKGKMHTKEEEDTKMEKQKRNRTEEERAQEARVMPNMNYEDKLYIPPEIIPDGVDYYWVRVAVRGEPDTSRMVQMQRKGWTPVPASRHPQYALPDFFGRTSQYSDYIHQDGLVLCERPKEYGVEETKRLEQKNHEILVSMPGTENFMGEPNIPTKSSGATYVSKGIRNASFGT